MRPLAALVTACLLGSLAAAVPLASPSAEAATKTVSARVLLAKLSVHREDHSKKLDRGTFEFNHADPDGDGCFTRNEVLLRDSVKRAKVSASCSVTGKWRSPYDGRVTTDATTLDIDHVVPLAEAWSSGARKWSLNKRTAFGNDLGYKLALRAVTKKQTRAKGGDDPADWMPTKDRCAYAAAWIGVKYRWKLSVDSREKATLSRYLTKCHSPRVLRPAAPAVSTLIGLGHSSSDESEPSDEPGDDTAPPSGGTPSPSTSPISSCPSGKVFGAVDSVQMNWAKSSSYYTYYNASGFVRNDSSAPVEISSLSPQVAFYSSSGAQTDFTYGDWDYRGDLKVGAYGGMVLPAGGTAKWRVTDGIMDRSDWTATSFAVGAAVSPFGAYWADSTVPYTCASPNQASETRTQYTIAH